MMSLFTGKFYDFYIHSFPEGADSVTKLAFAAKNYGYAGLTIVNSPITEQDRENKPQDFSLHTGIEISGKPSRIRSELQKHKGKKDIFIVKGGDEELNRAAVEKEGLDVLLQPVQFNHVLAKFASDNSIALGFDIGSIFRTRGEDRIRSLMIMRRNLAYARKYHVGMILTSNAYSHYDLRPPREMSALAGLFGMTAREAVGAMSAAFLDILKRKSRDYIQEGIEI